MFTSWRVLLMMRGGRSRGRGRGRGERPEVSAEKAFRSFLATQQSGGLPPLKVCLPVLEQWMGSRSGPFIFCGFPRMAPHVKACSRQCAFLSSPAD